MGTGSTTGTAVGGAAGAIAGSYFGPVGTIAGGYLGGYLGGAVGGLFDSNGNPALDTLSGEDKNNWKGTTAEAERRLGNDYSAPQIGQQFQRQVGTDPNGEPIYETSGASVAAPKWQQAEVFQGNAATASGAQAQAGPSVSAAPNVQASSANAASMGGAQLDATQANQTRQAQNQLASSLQSTAAGQGPSVAQEQLRQATAANNNQEMAAAQSMHGAARLAALRNASATNAATNQTAASQAVGLRAQEIAAAQGNLGNVLGSSRGQDLAAAQANAQLAQQTGAMNSGYQQSANQLNAQLEQQAAQYNSGNQQQANIYNAQLGNQLNLTNAQLAQQNAQYNAGNRQAMSMGNLGALNSSASQYASAQNNGNLSLAQSNLSAQQGTNALNTQRAQSLVGANQNMAGALTDIDKTRYTGQQSQNQINQQTQGNMLNNFGQAVATYYGSGGGS